MPETAARLPDDDFDAGARLLPAAPRGAVARLGAPSGSRPPSTATTGSARRSRSPSGSASSRVPGLMAGSRPDRQRRRLRAQPGRERGRRAHARAGHPDQRQPDGPPARRRPQAAAYARATPASRWGCTSTSASGSQRDGRWAAVYEVVPLDGDPQAVEAEVRAPARALPRADRPRPHAPRLAPARPQLGVRDRGLPAPGRANSAFRCAITSAASPTAGTCTATTRRARRSPRRSPPAALIDIIAEPGPGRDRAGVPSRARRRHGIAYDREREQEVEILCDPRRARGAAARGRRAAIVR